jgi:hypothetical protein
MRLAIDSLICHKKAMRPTVIKPKIEAIDIEIATPKIFVVSWGYGPG